MIAIPTDVTRPGVGSCRASVVFVPQSWATIDFSLHSKQTQPLFEQGFGENHLVKAEPITAMVGREPMLSEELYKGVGVDGFVVFTG